MIITVNKAVASGNRVADVFEINSSMHFNEQIPENTSYKSNEAVTFSNVSLTYQNGGEEALSDIDFQVKSGQTIGIIGGTGSGKSSVVNMIARFYDATKGAVLINGINVKDYPASVLHEKVGVVMQKAVLFKGNIEENLKWGKIDASKEEMEAAIKAAQADDIVKDKGGLSAKIAQEGKNLSGGQRQRMTIARALVKKPEILILDDSASALDMATDARLRKALKELDYRPTVFIVSQRTSAIQSADQIIVLDDGKLVGKGTHEELLKECEVYNEIYYSQYKREVDA